MPIPAQQKALIIPAAGADFQVGTLGVPKPDAGEVLVRVDVVGLNPVDWKIQQWGIVVAEYPAVVGCEVTGVVVEAGPEVTNLLVGDLIAFQTNPTHVRNGAFKQFTVVKAAFAFKVPPNISKDQAATTTAGSLTAVHMLYTDDLPDRRQGGANLIPFWRDECRGKYVGIPIVIFGGASSNGLFAIQVARLAGFSPIIATASLRNEDLLKSYGATHVIGRTLKGPELIARAQEIAGKPIQIIYDAISLPDTQNVAYDVLSSGGTLFSSLPPTIDQSKIVPDKKAVFISGQVDYSEYATIDTEFFAIFGEYLRSGEIKPLIPEYIPGGLAAIPGGLERLKNNQVSARKLVVRLEDTA